MAEEDPRKIKSELNKSAEGLTEEIDKAKSGLKPRFTEMINNIKNTNAPLAKTVAELRKTSKDTFAGALSANKLAGLTSIIEKYVAEGAAALDASEMEQIQRNFTTASGEVFDFEAFKETSDKVNQTTQEYKDLLDEEAALNDARMERLAVAEKSGNALGKLDSKINDLKERQLQASGFELNQITQQIEEEKAKRDEKQKQILASYDRQIEETKEQREKLKDQLDAEEDTRKEFNEQLSYVLGEAVNFEGLEMFSNSLKELTGLDLIGNLNTMVDKINAIGGLFGKKDLFGSIVSGFQNMGSMVKSFGSAIADTGRAIVGDMARLGASALGVLSTLGRSFMGALTSMGTLLLTAATGLIAGAKAAAFAAGGFVLGLLSAAASMLVAAAPFLAIGAAIAAGAFLIYKAGEYLYENSETFRNFIDSTWQLIKDTATTIFDAAKGLWETISGIWGSLTEKIGSVFDGDGFIQDIKDTVAMLFDLIKKPIKALTDFFMGEEDPDVEKAKQEQEAARDRQKDALKAATDSGLYDENFFGDSDVDFSKVQSAPAEQLEAILADNDISDETRAKLEDELRNRDAAVASQGVQVPEQEVPTVELEPAPVPEVVESPEPTPVVLQSTPPDVEQAIEEDIARTELEPVVTPAPVQKPTLASTTKAAMDDETTDFFAELDSDEGQARIAADQERRNAEFQAMEEAAMARKERIASAERASNERLIEKQGQYQSMLDSGTLDETKTKFAEAQIAKIEGLIARRSEKNNIGDVVSAAIPNLDQDSNRVVTGVTDSVDSLTNEVMPGEMKDAMGLMSSGSIKASTLESEEVKESKSAAMASINNVVGGTSVTNVANNRFMGPAKIKDDDSSLMRVNRVTDW